MVSLTALISLSEMTALHSYLSLKGHLTSASLLCITDCLMHSLEDILIIIHKVSCKLDGTTHKPRKFSECIITPHLRLTNDK